MNRFCNVPALCLLLSLYVVNVAAQSCSDARGTAVCQSMINAFKKLNPFPSNPSYAYTGNKCTIAGDPYNLFRPSCCVSCRAYLGGSSQAQKDASYMNLNPTPTPVCGDSSTATTRCNTLAAMDATTRATYCNQPMGTDRILCPSTCGFCDSGYIASAITTAASCVGGSTCYNSTMCNANNATGMYCSTSGSAASGTSSVQDGGLCSCDTCTLKSGAPCTSDTDCGGLPYACQANAGKCACPACTINKPCMSDYDCGGYAGTCGYLTSPGSQWWSCSASTGTGSSTTSCSCLWCPTKACYADGLQCLSSTAASTCGDASFCIGTSTRTTCASTDTACTCQCTLAASRISSSSAGGALVTLDGTRGPVCIQGAACSGLAATSSTAAGFANCGVAANCLNAAGATCTSTTTYAALTALTTTPTCKCSCAVSTVNVPNQCLGFLYATPSSTVYSTCTLNVPLTTTAGPCGAYLQSASATPLIPVGALIINVCAPDMTATVQSPTCKCDDIYSSYSRKEGAQCSVDTDCETSQYSGYLSICQADSVCSSCPNRCTAAMKGKIASTCTSSTSTACGLGKCYSSASSTYRTAACTSSTASCACVPAGCKTNRACGLGSTNSKNTCGGDAFACRGKCYGATGCAGTSTTAYCSALSTPTGMTSSSSSATSGSQTLTCTTSTSSIYQADGTTLVAAAGVSYPVTCALTNWVGVGATSAQVPVLRCVATGTCTALAAVTGVSSTSAAATTGSQTLSCTAATSSMFIGSGAILVAPAGVGIPVTCNQAAAWAGNIGSTVFTAANIAAITCVAAATGCAVLVPPTGTTASNPTATTGTQTILCTTPSQSSLYLTDGTTLVAAAGVPYTVVCTTVGGAAVWAGAGTNTAHYTAANIAAMRCIPAYTCTALTTPTGATGQITVTATTSTTSTLTCTTATLTMYKADGTYLAGPNTGFTVTCTASGFAGSGVTSSDIASLVCK